MTLASMATAFLSLRALAGSPWTAAAEPDNMLERARRGDHAAFRVIHQRYHASVRRLLGELLRDGAAADEAAQETFVRAFVRLDTLHDGARLHGWLMGIARRVAMEQWRLRKRLWPGFAPAASEEVAHSRSPEEVALGRESGQALEWALTQLREERRLALLLRADQGLSCEDVACALGWTLSKTKVELHRARHQLRELMARYPGQGASR